MVSFTSEMGVIGIKKKYTSPIKHTEGFKRYYTMDYYLKHKYGRKMCKIPLSTGFTCPNRDGRKGIGGCCFCSGDGGAEFAPKAALSIEEQFKKGAAMLLKKWPDAGFIGYFQSFTNTYGPIDKLDYFLKEACQLPIEGIRIATRGDCIDEETADLLAYYNERMPLVAELGLQTIFDKTAKRMNRCHSYAEFLQGYELLKERGIKSSVHIINGLPGETGEMMIETAKTVGELMPLSIKIHMLHILKGSALGALYETEPFPLISKEEYVDIVVRQLEVIDENIVIERLTGDGASSTLLAPMWTKKKLTVINDIDKLLYERNTYQGRLVR